MRRRIYVLRPEDDPAEIIGMFTSFGSAEREASLLGLARTATWVEVFNGRRIVKVWHYPAHRIELWQVEPR